MRSYRPISKSESYIQSPVDHAVQLAVPPVVLLGGGEPQLRRPLGHGTLKSRQQGWPVQHARAADGEGAILKDKETFSHDFSI